MIEETQRMLNDLKQSKKLSEVRKDGEKVVDSIKSGAGTWGKRSGSILIGIFLNIFKLVLYAPLMLFVEPFYSVIKKKETPEKKRFLR